MKDIFICLLSNLKNLDEVEITSAHLYEKEISSIDLNYNGETYHICVSNEKIVPKEIK